MTTKVILKHENGMIKEGYIGFSWTCLFFGPFVPLLRGDHVNALVALLLNFLCGGLYLKNRTEDKRLI